MGSINSTVHEPVSILDILQVQEVIETGILPSSDDLKIMLVVGPAIILVFVLFFYPPDLWLPFASEFPDWLMSQPVWMTVMQLEPLWVAGVILGGLLMIGKRLL